MYDMVESTIATIYTIGLYDADDPDRNPGLHNALPGLPAVWPISRRTQRVCCPSVGPSPRKFGNSIPSVIPPPQAVVLRCGTFMCVSAPGRSKLTMHTRTSYRYDEVDKPK
jgi:hypothetical protein